MERISYMNVFTVNVALPCACAPQITGTLRGYQDADDFVVCSVYPALNSIYGSTITGQPCPVGRDSKVFTINAVATSVYRFITEKALHFATVVTAVVKRACSRYKAFKQSKGNVTAQRHIHREVLLCCAGGLRL